MREVNSRSLWFHGAAVTNNRIKLLYFYHLKDFLDDIFTSFKASWGREQLPFPPPTINIIVWVSAEAIEQ